MKQDILDTEVEQCNTFQYVTLLGEFNARTADIEDICNIDDEVLNSVQIDADVVFNLNINRELINKDISYKRVSKDKTPNRLGRVLINFCKINDLLILNGRAFDKRNIGNFTCRNASVGSNDENSFDGDTVHAILNDLDGNTFGCCKGITWYSETQKTEITQ